MSRPGQPGHVRVALEPRVGAVEGQQLLDREVAAQRHRRVQPDRGVALGQDEAVAVRPGGLVGSDPQLVEVQRGQHVGGRQRAAQVPGAGVVDGPDHLDPDPARRPPAGGRARPASTAGPIGAAAHGGSFFSYEPETTGGVKMQSSSSVSGPSDSVAWNGAGRHVDDDAGPDLGDGIRGDDAAAARGAVDRLLLGGVDVALRLRARRGTARRPGRPGSRRRPWVRSRSARSGPGAGPSPRPRGSIRLIIGAHLRRAGRGVTAGGLTIDNR